MLQYIFDHGVDWGFTFPNIDVLKWVIRVITLCGPLSSSKTQLAQASE